MFIITIYKIKEKYIIIYLRVTKYFDFDQKIIAVINIQYVYHSFIWVYTCIDINCFHLIVLNKYDKPVYL